MIDIKRINELVEKILDLQKENKILKDMNICLRNDIIFYRERLDNAEQRIRERS